MSPRVSIACQTASVKRSPALPVGSARELAHPLHGHFSLRGVGHPVAPSVQGANDRGDHVGAVGKGWREKPLLPSSAHPADELLLARLAVNALLHESEDRKAATQRLLELLLGRAHAALARLAVLGAEQQQVSVAGWDLVKQRPARAPVARRLGLEYDGIHPKRLDCRPAATADSGHVTTEQ